MSTTTTNLGYIKPAVNSATDENLWGTQINANFDAMDTDIYTALQNVKNLVLSKSSNYTVTTSDVNKLIECNANGGAFTITLPAAATAGDGFSIMVKKIDTSTNFVTIDADGSEEIDGETTREIKTQYEVLQIVTDGIKWSITNEYKISLTGSTQTSSAVDVTLTYASTKVQEITMTAADKSVILPDATTLEKGFATFKIINGGSNSFAIKDDGGNILANVFSSSQFILSLINNSTSNGIWSLEGLDIQEFTSSGTWTKPSFGNTVKIELLSAGGAGGSYGASDKVATGGGGGGYLEIIRPIADFDASETVTIGLGGAGVSGTSNGNGGGASSITIGTETYQIGGGGGGTYGANDTDSRNGGNGGSTQYTILEFGKGTYNLTNGGISALFSGAGGYTSSGSPSNGGNSIYGGGGGGAIRSGITRSGGSSLLAGNGGNSGQNGAATNGTFPSGGGGGNVGTGSSGSGANGFCRVTTY